MKNKLWTRDFTILTLGSIVSMFGNAASGFAISILVLDYTNSTFLYAFFMVVYFIPHIIAPLFAGPYMDRFSRKKVIYTLDFISAGMYVIVFALIFSGWFNYPIFLMLTLLIGCIDSVYSVAYDSLYPNLVTEGNLSKAYSISSIIYPIASVMVFVSSIIYSVLGTVAPIFAFNAITFLVAAIFETRIEYHEKHIKSKKKEKFNLEKYKTDFIEGFNYIKGEKGLMVITIYFFITMFANGASSTLTLPFFKNNTLLFPQYELFGFIITSIVWFSIISGIGVLGRLIGGVIHYQYKYPIEKKFNIALFVYTTISIIEAFTLYLPVWVMMINFFIVGILGVTSFNIRISATQAYVPDSKRGRFNGTFQMFMSFGAILGQLAAGSLGEFVPERIVIMAFMGINMLAVYFVMYKGRKHVKVIYNRDS
ncbi:MAG: hypothetical protein A2Y17_08845 [Clostridiales bacterium GWF2_38_85]|nr:MAG: hypothetical protein A2Y17_08845 [Clostridiales bacterium GWF2_38_85]HBL83697.1 hypothetical protein [Clostridiales bacterium]